jgi:hypothetical protein
VINNAVLDPLNFAKRVDHMLSALSREGTRNNQPKGVEKLLEIMGEFFALIVMVLWVFPYLQTHQIVHMNIYTFFICLSCFNKEVWKKKKVTSHFISSVLPLPKSLPWNAILSQRSRLKTNLLVN